MPDPSQKNKPLITKQNNMLQLSNLKINPKIRVLTVIATIIILAYFFNRYLHEITHWLHRLGYFAPLLFILLYTLVAILWLPSIVLVLAGGVLFGPILGSVLNLIGAISGAVCSFCISRYLIADIIVIKKHSKIATILDYVDRYGWKSVALLRILPAMPYNFVNYGLGITHVKFKHYFIASAIFLIPSKVIGTYFGYAGIKILGY